MSAADEAALIAAIEAAPDDDAPRMVYADWLLERGDPRGELIQIQTARRDDPWWTRDRLERREQRLAGKLHLHPALGTLFDRGEQGIDFEVGDHVTLPARSWLRPRSGYRYAPPEVVTRALEDFVASEVFTRVRRLDLSAWHLGTWTRLLDSAARPRHVVLPHDSGAQLDALCEAPLLANVERLELRGNFDDARLARLLSAPWARQLVQLSLAGGTDEDRGWSSYWRPGIDPVSDAGIEAIATGWLPRLRSLDARHVQITARGVAALAASPLALAELRLSADTLGADGFAVLDRSRLASITRTGLAGPWLSSPDAVVALVRSPTWSGGLDLQGIGRYDAQGRERDLDVGVLEALATLSTSRPLRALRMGYLEDTGFFSSPIARSLERLTAIALPALGPEMRLIALRVAKLDMATVQDLASPALSSLERLAIGLPYSTHQGRAIEMLVASPLRPLDLEIKGQSTTGTTERLIRSPVLERIVDLTLALEGNHASKIVGKALLETPYLQQVERMELDFLSTFPAAQRTRIAARYGAALR